MTLARAAAIGSPVDRLEGREKVAGQALNAYEHHVDRPAYATIVVATVARGRICSFDASAALALDGVLAVVRVSSVKARASPLIVSDASAYSATGSLYRSGPRVTSRGRRPTARGRASIGTIGAMDGGPEPDPSERRR